MEQQIPLNSEASEGDTHKQTTTTLPPDVVQCLENARFVRRRPLPRTLPPTARNSRSKQDKKTWRYGIWKEEK
ncbi:hypothetical protein AUP68_06811 [Ilyonectria robusta]